MVLCLGLVCGTVHGAVTSQGYLTEETILARGVLNGPATEIASGDIDGDGWSDIVLGGNGGPTRIHLSLEGTFTTTASMTLDTGNVGALLLADMDADGYLDLVVGGKEGLVSRLYLYDDGFTLQETWAYFEPSSVDRMEAYDVDVDGYPELFIGTENGSLWIFDGTGGHFEPGVPTLLNGTHTSPVMLFLDVTGNGRDDLVVGNGVGEVWYHPNLAGEISIDPVLLGNASRAIVAMEAVDGREILVQDTRDLHILELVGHGVVGGVVRELDVDMNLSRVATGTGMFVVDGELHMVSNGSSIMWMDLQGIERPLLVADLDRRGTLDVIGVRSGGEGVEEVILHTSLPSLSRDIPGDGRMVSVNGSTGWFHGGVFELGVSSWPARLVESFMDPVPGFVLVNATHVTVLDEYGAVRSAYVLPGNVNSVAFGSIGPFWNGTVVLGGDHGSWMWWDGWVGLGNEPYTSAVSPLMSVRHLAIGDLDDDDTVEVLVTTTDGELFILEGTTDGILHAPFSRVASDVVMARFADMDGDGTDDILAARVNGVTVFTETTGLTYPVPGPVTDVALSGADGDRILARTDEGVWELVLSDLELVSARRIHEGDVTMGHGDGEPVLCTSDGCVEKADGVYWSGPAITDPWTPLVIDLNNDARDDGFEVSGGNTLFSVTGEGVDDHAGVPGEMICGDMVTDRYDARHHHLTMVFDDGTYERVDLAYRFINGSLEAVVQRGLKGVLKGNITSCGFGYLDGDTVLDLVVLGDGKVSYHRGAGPGFVDEPFPVHMVPNGSSISIMDIDYDGVSDVIVEHDGGMSYITVGISGVLPRVRDIGELEMTTNGTYRGKVMGGTIVILAESSSEHSMNRVASVQGMSGTMAVPSIIDGLVAMNGMTLYFAVPPSTGPGVWEAVLSRNGSLLGPLDVSGGAVEIPPLEYGEYDVGVTFTPTDGSPVLNGTLTFTVDPAPYPPIVQDIGVEAYVWERGSEVMEIYDHLGLSFTWDVATPDWMEASMTSRVGDNGTGLIHTWSFHWLAPAPGVFDLWVNGTRSDGADAIGQGTITIVKHRDRVTSSGRWVVSFSLDSWSNGTLEPVEGMDAFVRWENETWAVWGGYFMNISKESIPLEVPWAVDGMLPLRNITVTPGGSMGWMADDDTSWRTVIIRYSELEDGVMLAPFVDRPWSLPDDDGGFLIPSSYSGVLLVLNEVDEGPLTVTDGDDKGLESLMASGLVLLLGSVIIGLHIRRNLGVGNRSDDDGPDQ